MNSSNADDVYSVSKLTEEARRLAADYRRATGKTLPLSPEIAVNDAVRLLGLTPSEDESCDAYYDTPAGQRRVVIKGRAIFDQSKNAQRIGQLKLDKAWDEALLVIMDENYETTEIYRVERAKMDEIMADKPANKRGAMTVKQFKIIANKAWPRD